MSKKNLIGVALLAGGLAACSTAPFREPVAQFGAQLSSLRTTTDAWTAQAANADAAYPRTRWLRDRSTLHLTAACEPYHYHEQRPACTLAVVPASGRVTGEAPRVTWRIRPEACADGLPSARITHDRRRSLAAVATRVSARQDEPAASTLDVLAAYGAQLAGLASAENAKAFDEATTAMEAAIGQVGAMAGPYGAAAQAAAGGLLWLVGQGLEFQRRQAIISAVNAACPLVRILVRALPLPIADQREAAMESLHRLAAEQLTLTNHARVRLASSTTEYAAALDQTITTVRALQALHALNPQAFAQGILTAHDNLVVAVNNPQVDLGELFATLQDFAKHIQGLQTAFAGLRTP